MAKRIAKKAGAKTGYVFSTDVVERPLTDAEFGRIATCLGFTTDGLTDTYTNDRSHTSFRTACDLLIDWFVKEDRQRQDFPSAREVATELAGSISNGLSRSAEALRDVSVAIDGFADLARTDRFAVTGPLPWEKAAPFVAIRRTVENESFQRAQMLLAELTGVIRQLQRDVNADADALEASAKAGKGSRDRGAVPMFIAGMLNLLKGIGRDIELPRNYEDDIFDDFTAFAFVRLGAKLAASRTNSEALAYFRKRAPITQLQWLRDAMRAASDVDHHDRAEGEWLRRTAEPNQITNAAINPTRR